MASSSSCPVREKGAAVRREFLSNIISHHRYTPNDYGNNTTATFKYFTDKTKIDSQTKEMEHKLIPSTYITLLKSNLKTMGK